MRKLLFIFCMTAAAMMVSCGKKQPKTPEPAKPTEQVERIDTTATLVMQIQKCSRLYTTEYQVHKIVTHDDEIKLKGKLFSKKYNITLPLGKRKVAIPMEATLKAYVDFAEFSADNVRRDSTHIELILPDPRIVLTSSRIDHNEIKEYVALMRSNFSEEELQSYEMQGREVIIHDIANSDITERARQSAANAIVPILRQLGYKPQNITISFRKKFTPADVEGIIGSSSVENKGNAARR